MSANVVLEKRPHELRAVVSLALLYVFRMLGLFMLLPVLVDYGRNYQSSSPELLGLALGAYGFSQALLQIPFGWWSDRWGRKPVITVGLLLFALGSIIAAVSDSVYGLILGRFLQGGGAIAAAIMAMVADLTSDQNRTKSMAAIGASIGVSFLVAVVLGPKLAAIGGLPLVFWTIFVLACVGLVVLWTLVPNVTTFKNPEKHPARFRTVLRNPELLRLNFGIFALHFVLAASFVVLPLALGALPAVSREQHSWIYLWVLLGSFVAMLPVMILAERKNKVKWAFLAAVVLVGIAQFIFISGHGALVTLVTGLFVFFMAFNYLEASLPSLMSKMAPSNVRGAATGIYSSCQSFGVFLGGSCGGLLLAHGGMLAVFICCAALVLIWLVVAAFMHGPVQYSNLVVPVDEPQREKMLNRLAALPGVAEVSYLEDQQAAFLRVDDRYFQRESLLELEAT